MMRLKPKTRLTLAAADTKKRGVHMRAGAALFNIGKRRAGDDPFTVTSPTSVATVKGTRFWVRVGDDSASVLVCLEGTVRLAAAESGSARDVDAGMTGGTDGDELTVRTTVSSDLPSGEATQELEIRFKDDDGSTKRLRIESVPSK
jgi:ferric-dicitrate binding protein FerR (iron transport regulator)